MLYRGDGPRQEVLTPIPDVQARQRSTTSSSSIANVVVVVRDANAREDLADRRLDLRFAEQFPVGLGLPDVDVAQPVRLLDREVRDQAGRRVGGQGSRTCR